MMFGDIRVSYFPYRRSRSADEIEQYLENEITNWTTLGYGRFSLRLKSNNQFVGVVGPKPSTWPPDLLPSIDLGWRLHPSYWDQGLATEAARRIIQWIIELQLSQRLICSYEPANVASEHVAHKLGMERWGKALHPRFGIQNIDMLEICQS